VDGHAELLKERAIGRTLRTQAGLRDRRGLDRTGASERSFRRRLSQYYEQGPQGEVQFDLGSGSVRPKITIREPVPHGRSSRFPPVPLPQARRRWMWYAARAVSWCDTCGVGIPFAGAGPSRWSDSGSRWWTAHSPALLWTSAGEFQRLPRESFASSTRRTEHGGLQGIAERSGRLSRAKISSAICHAIVASARCSSGWKAPQYRVGGEIRCARWVAIQWS